MERQERFYRGEISKSLIGSQFHMRFIFGSVVAFTCLTHPSMALAIDLNAQPSSVGPSSIGVASEPAVATNPSECEQLLLAAPGEGGLVTDQVDLSVHNLVTAYANGVFPWQDLGDRAGWYRPETRGVLFFDRFSVSKSLRKILKSGQFEVTFDQAFDEVIKGCRMAHQATGEWISDRFVDTYIELHKRGFAHSVEVWVRDEKGERHLAGGVYGVFVSGVFAGESMFRNPTLGKLSDNASKVAVYHLIERLKARGHTWIDTQMVTEATAALGAVELSRDEHLALLRRTQVLNLSF